jgi:hypothetical protein
MRIESVEQSINAGSGRRSAALTIPPLTYLQLFTTNAKKTESIKRQAAPSAKPKEPLYTHAPETAESGLIAFVRTLLKYIFTKALLFHNPVYLCSLITKE